jgi:hypothetical protein
LPPATLFIRLLFAFSLLGVVSAPSAVGQVSFLSTPTYTGQGTPFLADFNSDGKTDILTGGDGTMNLGNGNGTFTLGTTVVGGAAAVADFNGDGKPDVLQIGSAALKVLLGKGDGTFQAPIGTNSNATLAQVAAADLNGDGDADVVGIFNASLMVYLSRGDGSFLPGVAYSLGITPNQADVIVFGDFNGDGKTDVAVVANGQDVVLLGNGDGTFQAAKSSPGINFPGSAVVGDFNGDGNLDLVDCPGFSGPPLPNVTIQLGNGDGTFQAPIAIAPGNGVVTADLNGDGKLDLAINGAVLGIFLGNGDGTFSLAYGYEGLAQAVGDFNQDGKLDIAGHGILLGNGDGTFQANPAVAVNSLKATLAPAAGDFNKDGSQDLAVIAETNPNSYGYAADIFLNNGSGQLTSTNSYPLFQPQTVSVMATADVNGDGNLDLVIIGSTWPNGSDWLVNVLLGNGDGTFGLPIISSVPNKQTSSPISVSIVDFNNDHKLDLTMPSNDNTVVVLLGNGDGTFGSPVEYFAGGVLSIASADFNGDGNLDVAAAGSGGLAILLGKGDGTFQPATFPYTATSFYSVVEGDLNGDGKADLLAAGQSGGMAFLGNGDGTFRALSSVAADFLTDIDGDGKLDAIGAQNIGGESVSIDINLGNGDGTFGPPIDVLDFYPGSFFFVVPVDMNGDGKPDLVYNTGAVAALFELINTTPRAPVVIFSPSSVNFASQTVGTNSSPSPVTLTNEGNMALSVTGVSIGGTNASEFSQTNNCNTVQPKTSCTINVTFSPTAAGGATANLMVADNAGTGSQMVGLAGTGDTQPTFTLAPVSGSPTSAMVSPGKSAVFNLAVGSTSSWTGTVNLACSITPMVASAPTCTVPSSVAVPVGMSAPFSATVATVAPGAAGSMSSASVPPGAVLLLGTMALFGAGLLSIRRQRLPVLGACAMMVALIAMPACGGNGSGSSPTGTPAGTYTATVTATSGSVSQKTALTVVVQ